MEAGYDYLLLRSRMHRQLIRASGMSLAVIGGVLLSASIAYFIYAYQARSDLDSLNYAVTAPQGVAQSIPAKSNPIAAVPGGVSEPYIAPSSGLQGVVSPPIEPFETARGSQALPSPPEVVPAVEVVSQSPQPLGSEAPPVVKKASPQISPSAIAAQQLYPGEALKATYWSNPLEYEPTSYLEAAHIQGFRPLDPGLAALPGTLTPPTRLVIPSIGVDSDVNGLEILDLGDSKAYETPNNVVGHIPEMSNPGEKGSTWFFGHLESPIAGEGSVFHNLPKIPDLLRKGEEVYIIVDNGSRSYLYQVTETFVVGQDELKLDYGYLQTIRPEYAQLDPEGANIHLVVCVPKLVYDSRLIVSGRLVGTRS